MCLGPRWMVGPGLLSAPAQGGAEPHFSPHPQGSILKAHMVTHSSRKDHECKLCGASFRTKGSLIRHHRRHTGEPGGAGDLSAVLRPLLGREAVGPGRWPCPGLTMFFLQMSAPISVPSVGRASGSQGR